MTLLCHGNGFYFLRWLFPSEDIRNLLISTSFFCAQQIHHGSGGYSEQTSANSSSIFCWRMQISSSSPHFSANTFPAADSFSFWPSKREICAFKCLICAFVNRWSHPVPWSASQGSGKLPAVFLIVNLSYPYVSFLYLIIPLCMKKVERRICEETWFVILTVDKWKTAGEKWKCNPHR